MLVSKQLNYMRIILTILLYSLAIKSQAQMTLENSYSAQYGRMVKFSSVGYKYVMMDDVNKQVGIYNLNHTLYKMINVPQYTGISTNMDINWVSDNLFNSDNLIEYVVYYSNDHYDVVNENGVVINSVSGYGSGEVFVDGMDNHKLILHYSSTTFVYDLPGSLPCMPTCGLLNVKPPAQSPYSLLSPPVPNPSSGEVTVNYILPASSMDGTITLFNSLGQQVEQYNVMNSDRSLIIKTTNLVPGNYYYQLKTGSIISDVRKLTVIK